MSIGPVHHIEAFSHGTFMDYSAAIGNVYNSREVTLQQLRKL